MVDKREWAGEFINKMFPCELFRIQSLSVEEIMLCLLFLMPPTQFLNWCAIKIHLHDIEPIHAPEFFSPSFLVRHSDSHAGTIQKKSPSRNCFSMSFNIQTIQSGERCLKRDTTLYDCTKKWNEPYRKFSRQFRDDSNTVREIYASFTKRMLNAELWITHVSRLFISCSRSFRLSLCLSLLMPMK